MKVVVDTNVIIDLAKIFGSGKINTNDRKENSLSQIFTMIADGRVQLQVVPKVAQEIKRGSKKDKGLSEMFMTKYCDEIELSPEEKHEAQDLAYDYGNVLVGQFPAVAFAQNSTSKNFSDALIVAQISIAQRKLGEELLYMTQNTKDVFDTPSINVINEEHSLPEIKIFSRNGFMRNFNKTDRHF